MVDTQWIDDESVSRSPQVRLDKLQADLEANPGKWAVYSTHRSVPASRTRKHRMKKSKRWVEAGAEWACRVLDGVPTVLIRIPPHD